LAMTSTFGCILGECDAQSASIFKLLPDHTYILCVCLHPCGGGTDCTACHNAGCTAYACVYEVSKTCNP
jgi:hypothetical protein